MERIARMKNPKIIIWDEATESIICEPTKYELMKAQAKMVKENVNLILIIEKFVEKVMTKMQKADADKIMKIIKKYGLYKN